MYLYIQCDERGTPKNQFTYKTLSLSHEKKSTGKLQMKRMGFSDKRSHRIKK